MFEVTETATGRVLVLGAEVRCPDGRIGSLAQIKARARGTRAHWDVIVKPYATADGVPISHWDRVPIHGTPETFGLTVRPTDGVQARTPQRTARNQQPGRPVWTDYLADEVPEEWRQSA